jgi:hypothetical protein
VDDARDEVKDLIMVFPEKPLVRALVSSKRIMDELCIFLAGF